MLCLKFYLLALSNAMHQGKNLYTLGGEYPTAGGKGQIFKYLLRWDLGVVSSPGCDQNSGGWVKIQWGQTVNILRWLQWIYKYKYKLTKNQMIQQQLNVKNLHKL